MGVRDLTLRCHKHRINSLKVYCLLRHDFAWGNDRLSAYCWWSHQAGRTFCQSGYVVCYGLELLVHLDGRPSRRVICDRYFDALLGAEKV